MLIQLGSVLIFVLYEASLWKSVFNQLSNICKRGPLLNAKDPAYSHVSLFILSHVLLVSLLPNKLQVIWETAVKILLLHLTEQAWAILLGLTSLRIYVPRLLGLIVFPSNLMDVKCVDWEPVKTLLPFNC